jgi:hypothetical protein
MKDEFYIFLTGYLLGMLVAAALFGQLVGWWARRNGISYVAKHLEITKP